MTPLLALHHVSKRFGGLTAVDDVSMSIRQGRNLRPDRAERRR